jgi:phytoene dehydrogenase-like protein
VAVVVVGAGIAGIACARELAAAGVEVRVLERARVVGGRMAS